MKIFVKTGSRAKKEKFGKRLHRSFYTRPTLRVAKELLGKYIVRPIRKSGKVSFLQGKIVEVEAYIGPKDKASHAYRGKITSRNKAEYLIGGHVYIYLVYGMYWQLNIVTGLADKPECVLIRAVEPIFNIAKNSKSKTLNPPANKVPLCGDKQIRNFKIQNSKNLTDGPGKLCRWLKLDKSFYGEDLTTSKRIWLEGREEKIDSKMIKSGPRIGIDYAGPYWSRRKWRFIVKNNECK